MLALMGLSAVGATIAPQKQVLVTYPNDTPQSELDEFRSAIESTGSEIVHEYSKRLVPSPVDLHLTWLRRLDQRLRCQSLY